MNLFLGPNVPNCIEHSVKGREDPNAVMGNILVFTHTLADIFRSLIPLQLVI